MNVALQPTEWGWKLVCDSYEPIMTDIGPAPEEILKLIRCNCKASKNLCGTNACTCRKTGLPCISACGQCNGKDCLNAADNNGDESDEDMDDEQNIFESELWN